MPAQMTAAENVVKEAEAYFAQHGIRELLMRVLVFLAKELPAEPTRAVRLYLEQAEAAKAAKGEQASGDAAFAERHSSRPPCMPASPAGQVPIKTWDLLSATPSLPSTAAPADGGASDRLLPTASSLASAAHKAEPGGDDAPRSASRGSGSARPPAEPVEDRDAEGDVEDVDPLQMLVTRRLPSAKAAVDSSDLDSDDLSQQRQWAGGFNRALFKGWVKQESPCCAAASTAGAINALWDRPRGCEGRSTVREVAELMAQGCDRQFSKQRTKLERRLGLDDGAFDEFLVALDERIEEMGLSWTAGTGPRAVTKKTAMKAVREVLIARAPQGEQAPVWAAAGSHEPERGLASHDNQVVGGRRESNVFAALHEMIVGVRRSGPGTNSEGDSGADDADVCADAAAYGTAEAGSIRSSAATTFEIGNVYFSQQFREMLWRRKGAMRLRAAKPNTGEVGSVGVKVAAEELVASRALGAVEVRTLIGRRGSASRVQVPVSSQDDQASVEQQWTTLKAAFARPHSVLLFHLTNHYALIFAWREWCEASPGGGDGQPTDRIRRQILTARKAQRPSAWIDFDEVRSIIFGWSGYNILHIERVPALAARTASEPEGLIDGAHAEGEEPSAAHGAPSAALASETVPLPGNERSDNA